MNCWILTLGFCIYNLVFIVYVLITCFFFNFENTFSNDLRTLSIPSDGPENCSSKEIEEQDLDLERDLERDLDLDFFIGRIVPDPTQYQPLASFGYVHRVESFPSSNV
jgi:hypothetical protein